MANGGAKRVRKLLDYVEDQGWRVEATADGYALYSPNRAHSPVHIHKTSSDHRAIQKIRTDLRKRDLDMPMSAVA